jgi:N-formylglutamate amidohydrolase
MRFALIAYVLAMLSPCLADEPARFGTNDYIEYVPGTLPLIITAPHGGKLKPENIPDRKYGVRDADVNTQELTRTFREGLLARYGQAPHMIICRLHRSKLDANRDLKEGAQGNAEAAKAWQEYHDFIKQARQAVEQQHGFGLLLDMHGHSHREGRVELGYRVSDANLRLDDTELAAKGKVIADTTIRDLDQRSPSSFLELLRGRQSLGGLLEARGFNVVPSPSIPAPDEGQLYFQGGYTSDVHGSRRGGSISAIQIESPLKTVRDTEEHRAAFLQALCLSLEKFYPLHFGKPLCPPKP